MIYTEEINFNVGFVWEWWHCTSIVYWYLTQKSEVNLTFTNKRGIAVIFLLCKSLFNIDQYVLGAA